MRAWRLDHLAQTGVAFDLETHLIQPGLVAPPIVCGSLACIVGGQIQGDMGLKPDALAAFRRILDDENLTLIGAHIAYDVLCEMVAFAALGMDIAPLVFRMYDRAGTVVTGDCDGRVIDVQVWEMLHAIARGHLGLDPRTMKKIINPETGKPGRYSLREVVKQVLGRDNAKANDRYRMSYALLEGTPLEQWPPEARAYPVDDAVNTLEAALAQAGLIDNVGVHEWVDSTGGGAPPHCAHCGAMPGGSADCRSRYRRLNSHELSRQTYFSLCADLGAAWGYKIDQAAVDALEKKWNAEHDPMRQPFVDAGIIRDDGSENQSVLKRYVAIAFGSTQPCPTCALVPGKWGPGKVTSTVTGKTPANCKECDGTGLLLTSETPRAEKGGIAKGRDALNQSGNDLLTGYAAYGEDRKIPTVYIPYMRNTDKDGVAHPEVPRLLRPNVIVESGRASYDGATMLLPRHGGVRECHVSRDGYVFGSVDYKAGELVAHGQSCIWIVGASRLAEALNKGLDAHLALAGTILGKSYEECQALKKAGDQLIKNTRQICKPPNFGFPGRMGPFKLVIQQRKQNDVHTPAADGPHWIYDDKGKRVRGYKGLRFCIFMGRARRCGEVMIDEWKGRKYDERACKACVECAADLRRDWMVQWPENDPYFDFVKRVDEAGYPVVQHVSKRLRGFRHGQVDDEGQPINSGNAIANTYFQAIIADAAKNWYMAASRECYDSTVRVRSFTRHTSRYEGGPSPLLGSHLPQFQHDEIIAEHPESVASDAIIRLAEIGEEALRIMCPDMDAAVEAEPTLMRKLYKGAEPIYLDREGKPCKRAQAYRIGVWEPKQHAA